MHFANRLNNIETSAIRELFKLLGNPEVISFAGGFPDAALFDIDGIRLASQQVLEAFPGDVLQYGATEGWAPLREALSRRMISKDIAAAPEEIITTTGSQQALDLLGKTMINPGDAVIVEAPTFLATIQCFRLYGANVIGAPTDADGVKVDALEQLIIKYRPKLIYLIPNFSNPSGATLSLERRAQILALATKYQVLVVEDDAYGELYFRSPPPPSLMAMSSTVAGSREWLAYCGSLSKVLSPGLRVGWLIAPPALLAKAVMCKQFSDAHSSNLTQAIAAQYLSLDRLDITLTHMRKTYSERSRTMDSSLRSAFGGALSFNRPNGGMFLWARLTAPGANAIEFSQRAIAQRVAFVPGAPFFSQHPDPATFRLSFAAVNESRILEGVSRLAWAM